MRYLGQLILPADWGALALTQQGGLLDLCRERERPLLPLKEQ